jgi:putative tryptophan/tyrosine transport system substrate-binding protein
MDRRRFLLTSLTGAVAGPLLAEAQQAGKRTIGVLNLTSAVSLRPYLDAFREGLRERGYIEGQSVAIELRSADDQIDRLPACVAELVALKARVIVTGGTTSVRAAKDATKTTPIVIAGSADPVGMGFAQSLAPPGGNITGLSLGAEEFLQKRLELLHEATPQAKLAALLLHAANPGNAYLVKAVTTAAPSLGLKIHVVAVRAVDDLPDAFAGMVRANADALLVMEDPSFGANAKKITDLALNHHLPTMLGNRIFVQAGGLIAYGIVYEDLWRRAAPYVDRILKGANPADMPIEQPNKFDLVINLKTAKALGLTIPPSLLARADLVIE